MTLSGLVVSFRDDKNYVALEVKEDNKNYYSYNKVEFENVNGNYNVKPIFKTFFNKEVAVYFQNKTILEMQNNYKNSILKKENAKSYVQAFIENDTKYKFYNTDYPTSFKYKIALQDLKSFVLGSNKNGIVFELKDMENVKKKIQNLDNDVENIELNELKTFFFDSLEKNLTSPEYVEKIGHYIFREARLSSIPEFVMMMNEYGFDLEKQATLLEVVYTLVGKMAMSAIYGIEFELNSKLDEDLFNIFKKHKETIKKISLFFKEYFDSVKNGKMDDKFNEINSFFGFNALNFLNTFTTLDENLLNLKNQVKWIQPKIISEQIKKRETVKGIKDYYILQPVDEEKRAHITEEFLNKNGLTLFSLNGKFFITNFIEKSTAKINYDFLNILKKPSVLSYIKAYKQYADEVISKSEEVIEYIRKHNKILFLMNSSLNNIDINTPFLKNPLFYNSKEKISLKEIFENPLIVDILRYTNYWDIIQTFAVLNDFEIPKKISFDLIPSTNEIIEPEKIGYEINANNLGMRRFGYIPNIVLKTDEDKKVFIEKLKEEFGDTVDFQDVEALINQADLISVINQRIIKNKLIQNEPTIVLFKNGKYFSSLNIDIFQYFDFIEKKFVKIKDLIKEPEIDNNSKYQIVFSISKQLFEYYKSLFENDFALLTKYASAFFKINEDGILDLNEINEKNIGQFTEIRKVVAKKLLNTKVIDQNIENIKREIYALNINPVEKNKIISLVENIDGIFENFDEINSLIVDIQLKNKDPEMKQKIEDAVKNILREINTILNYSIKETYSILYILKMAKHLQIIKTSDAMDVKIKNLNEAFRTFNLWAVKAVGLSKEQYKDALNSTLIELKNNIKVVNIFHDMGTGKTRLALFKSILLNALNPNMISAFAIQNKNSDDIYEQLKDMLPSLVIFVNKSFKNKNFVNNTEIPFYIVNEPVSNLTTSAFSDFWQTSEKRIKQEVIENYYDELLEIKEKIKHLTLKELSALMSNDTVNFHIVYDKVYKNVILNETSRLNTKVTKDHINRFNKQIFLNYASLALLLKKLYKEGNIKLEKIGKVYKKVENDLKMFYESFFYFINNQKDKRVFLISNSLFANVPVKNVKKVEMFNGNTNLKFSTFNKVILQAKDMDVLLSSDEPEIFNKIKHNEKEFLNVDYEKLTSDYLYLNESDSLELIVNKIFSQLKILNFNISLKPVKFVTNTVLCKEITENGVYKNVQAVTDLEKIEEFLKINGNEIKQFLENYKSNAFYGELKEIFSDARKFIQVANSIYLINFYNVLISPFSPSEKKKLLKLRNSLYETELRINIPFKELSNFIFYTKSGKFIYLYKASILEKTNEIDFKNKDIAETLKTVKDGTVTVNFRKNAFSYEFKNDNIIQNHHYKVNLNSSYLLNINDQTRKNLFIDESHKNQARNKNVFKQLDEKSKLIQLTGTPTKGFASSVALIANPLADENKIKETGKLMSIYGGIFNIKDSFFKKLLDEPPKTRAHIIGVYIDDFTQKNVYRLKYGLDSKTVTQILNEYFIVSLHYSFYKNLFFDGDKLKPQIYNMLEKESVSDQDILMLLKASFIKEFPGFSNPKNIVQLLPQEGIIHSIKTQADRVYNFIDFEHIKTGFDKVSKDFINNSAQELADVLLKEKISHLIYLVDNFKNSFWNIVIQELKDKMKIYYSHLYYERDDKLIEEFKDFCNNEGFLYSKNEILQLLTPKNVSGKDDMIFYFTEKVLLKNEIPQDKEEILNLFIRFVLKNEVSSILLELKPKLRKDMFIDKLYVDDNLDIHLNVNNDGTFEHYVFNPEITINLYEMFPDILKNEVKISFNVANPQVKEILEEITSYSTLKAVKNMEDFKNTILFTTRQKLLLLLSLRFLNEMAMKKIDNKPLYVFLNIPNTKEFNDMYNNLDIKYLKSKKIYVIRTNPQKIYNDYNYGIPTDARHIIISGYATLAEGFRFPKSREIIYSGHTNNIPTLLQSMARMFLPGKVNKSDIVLSTPSLKFSFDEKNSKYDSLKIIDNFILDPKLNNLSPYSIKMEILKKNHLKDISDAVIASLRFIGANIEGFESKKPEELIKHVIAENIDQNLLTPVSAKKIKAK